MYTCNQHNQSERATATAKDRDLCNVCGGVHPAAEVTETTVTDDSGGAFIGVCDGCLAYLRSQRCAVCGERKVGDHKAGAIVTGDEPDLPVCDPCRREIIHENGGVLS